MQRDALMPVPVSPPRVAGILLSVVVPVRNEAPNILPLVDEIHTALRGMSYEIVYVDDGSTDETPGRIAIAASTHTSFVHRRHRMSCGQSAAILTGIRAARGVWIATLDGDGQNDPADIPRLLAHAREIQVKTGAPILIAGHRTTRKDGPAKRIASRLANRIRARLLRDATPDTGCGLKVFPREIFLALPHFDHMHRYLPALFLRAGAQVISAPVNHRPRTQGKSNYGTLDRLWVGIFDLIGVAWLQRRGRRPDIESSSPTDPA